MTSNFNPQFSKIGEILVNNGKATESGINEALAQQKTTNDKLGLTLIEMGCLQLYESLALEPLGSCFIHCALAKMEGLAATSLQIEVVPDLNLNGEWMRWVTEQSIRTSVSRPGTRIREVP